MQARLESIELDSSHDLAFNYVVENKTERDYSIESMAGLRVFALRKDSSLSTSAEYPIRIETPLCIPAMRRALVRIHMHATYIPTGEKWEALAELARRNSVIGQVSSGQLPELQAMYRAYVRENLPRLNGFVLWTDETRDEILFPAGW